MGKTVSTGVLDAALTEVSTCSKMNVTSDEATATNLDNTLASAALTASIGGGGDYTLAAGDSSGRKLIVAQQTDVSITGTGTARHVVLSLAGGIKLVTTCTAQSLTSGNTVTVPAFDYEIATPI